MKLIFLLLLFFLNSCVLQSKKHKVKITHIFTASLKKENANHTPFINLINKEFAIKKNVLPNYYENHGYQYVFNKLDFVIDNNTPEIIDLFVNGNEQFIKDAAHEIIDRITTSLIYSVKHTSFVNLKDDYHNIINKFFEVIRRKFYKLDENSHVHKGSNEIDPLNFKLFYKNPQNIDDVLDLSGSNNSYILNQNFKNGLSDSSQNSDGLKEQEKSKEGKDSMSMNKALDIILKKSIFFIEETCVNKSKTSNKFSAVFKSQFNYEVLTTSCVISNKSSFIRGIDFDKKSTLNNIHNINDKQLNVILNSFFKTFNNIFTNDQSLNHFFENFGPISNKSPKKDDKFS